MDLFSGKKIFIYGLGKSGRTAAFALQEAGANVVVWDDDPHDLPSSTHDYRTQDPKKVNWNTVHILVKSPGIPLSVPAIQAAIAADVPVVSDVDLLASRSPDARYICVTGTNGKSTATSLIGHLLETAGTRVEMGGNLGIPAMSLPPLSETGTYVLELSSYQLETLSFLTPQISVFLNLTPDHLERHGNLEDYFNTKLRLFNAHADRGETAHHDNIRVMGVDQPIMAQKAAEIKAEGKNLTTVSVTGQPADITVNSRGILFEGEKKVIDLSQFYDLPGPHNWQNSACAWAALRHEMDIDTFAEGMRSFRPLPHRMERVCRTDAMTFVNDSKATNDEAAAFALRSFDNIYWICGGKPKVGRILPKCLENLQNVRAAFTIGDAQEIFAETLKKEGLPTFMCGNMERAIREAYAAAMQEGLPRCHILLSPACSSFDQYNSFEHRGDVFSSLAREVKEQHNLARGQESLPFINDEREG